MDIKISRTGYTLGTLKCFEDDDDDDSEAVMCQWECRVMWWSGQYFKDGDGDEEYIDNNGDVIKKQQPGRCSFKEVLCIHSTWLILKPGGLSVLFNCSFYCPINISLQSTNPTYLSVFWRFWQKIKYFDINLSANLPKDQVFWHQFAKVQVFWHQPNFPKDQVFWHQVVTKFAKRSSMLKPIFQIL